jgi:hypothetical protein
MTITIFAEHATPVARRIADELFTDTSPVMPLSKKIDRLYGDLGGYELAQRHVSELMIVRDRLSDMANKVAAVLETEMRS